MSRPRTRTILQTIRSLLVKQAAARAQEVTVANYFLKNQIEVAKQLEMAKSGDGQQTGQKVARDQTIRLQSLLKLAMEAQTLSKDQSRLLNRVDIYRSLQEAKQLPDFEPRVGTPMILRGSSRWMSGARVLIVEASHPHPSTVRRQGN